MPKTSHVSGVGVLSKLFYWEEPPVGTITDRRHHIVFRICEQKFRLLMAEERRASRFQRWRQMLLQDLKLLGIPAFYGALRLSQYNQARFRPLVCHGEQRTQAALQRNSA